MSETNSLKILVTGGSGYLGRVLLDLCQNKCKLSSMDNEYVGNSGYNPPNTISYTKGDIRNKNLMEKLISKNDVIIHLAGIVGDSCPKNPDVAHDVNVTATKDVAMLCKKFEKRLLFMSTCSVYGFNEDICIEETRLNPLNIYSEHKILGEQVIFDSDVNYLIFRMGTVYGWSPRMRFDLGINMFIEKAMWNEPIEVYGGNQWRPLIHVKDAAKALFMGAKNNELNGVLNLVAENHKLVELAKSITHNINIVDHKDDNRSYKVDNSAIKSKLKWSSDMNISKAIKEFTKVNYQEKIYYNRMWNYQ